MALDDALLDAAGGIGELAASIARTGVSAFGARQALSTMTVVIARDPIEAAFRFRPTGGFDRTTGADHAFVAAEQRAVNLFLGRFDRSASETGRFDRATELERRQFNFRDTGGFDRPAPDDSRDSARRTIERVEMRITDLLARGFVGF